jgi:hypothetical protein
MIKDEALRKAIELQIAHFGQIPMTLFRSPHPPRKVIPANPPISVPGIRIELLYDSLKLINKFLLKCTCRD